MIRKKQLGQGVVGAMGKAILVVRKFTLFPKVAAFLLVVFVLYKQITQVGRKYSSGLLFLKPLPPTIYSTNLSEYMPDGILIPASMNWIRNNQTIPSFIIEDQKQRSKTYTGKCSCENAKAIVQCCNRQFFVSHKMGYLMIRHIWDKHPKQFQWAESWTQTTANYIPNTDHRNVFLIRNIYDAILSGYRYHKSGNECWLDHHGNINPEYQKNYNLKERKLTYGFKSYLKLPLLYKATDVNNVATVQRYDNNLCEYLRSYSEKEGLRVYIDYAFHSYYDGMLGYWGYTRAIQSMNDRTMYVCYKDLTSIDNDLQTFNTALGFLYNVTNYKWELKSKLRPGGPVQYTGDHSTSIHAPKNETVYLLSLINELDTEVFNNEIAWINSVLPCQGERRNK